MKRITYTPGDFIGKCQFVLDIITTSKHRQATFNCPICNNTFTARIDHIKAEKTISCGCLLKQEAHGDHNTRLYHIWEAMKQRCLNSNHIKYKDYEARGITVCTAWLTYSTFKTWAISNGYDSTLTIDRINNDKGYEPSNCRFATKSVQSANSRSGVPNKTGFFGVSKDKNKFTVRICVNKERINLGTFITALEAAQVRDDYIKKNNLPNLLSIPTYPDHQYSEICDLNPEGLI